MRIVHWIGRTIERLFVASVALISAAIDAAIGLVGRISERLDARLAELARESKARHRQLGRRQVDPITLK